ncbi:hypothetical protein B0H67DRAFT_572824 [Lasiosphaeris hirsuta]|uniref:Uncharacterized protein n=1 Tax=Lasiosphaeris hirsuta TaxID=260670 RepID=A0AA40DXJ6_9PEZI|nr:hypothetical protein B0H67DRAFT_572824 [Lasiosphaeris hirsuta]
MPLTATGSARARQHEPQSRRRQNKRRTVARHAWRQCVRPRLSGRDRRVQAKVAGRWWVTRRVHGVEVRHVPHPHGKP